MYYCGLDVSRKSTHVHIEDGQGKRVEHRVVPTTPEGLESALENYFARGLRVAVEAGGSTGWIHDLLRELGARVHVVHPTKVKWIAASKKKTDRVDARLLAHLLRINGLPEAVHMPTRQSREVRRLLRARRQLVQIRTRLIIDMCRSNRHYGHKNAGSSEAAIKDRRSAGRLRAFLVIRHNAAMSSSTLSGRPLASVALK
jgi:transposase